MPEPNNEILKKRENYLRLFSLALERSAFHGLSQMYTENRFETAVSYLKKFFKKYKFEYVVFSNIPHLTHTITAAYALKMLRIPYIFKVTTPIGYPSFHFWSKNIFDLERIPLSIEQKSQNLISKDLKHYLLKFFHLIKVKDPLYEDNVL